MRRLSDSWTNTFGKLGFQRKRKRRARRQRVFRRRSAIESLESRQMLAITVNTLVDELDTWVEGGSGNYVTIVNSTFSANTSGWRGGGLYFSATTAVTSIVNSTITQNTATNGGGGGIFTDAPITLHNTIVAQNSGIGWWNGQPFYTHNDLYREYGSYSAASSNNLIGVVGWSGITAANGNLIARNGHRVIRVLRHLVITAGQRRRMRYCRLALRLTPEVM
jgi:hypothetical protein